MDPLDLFSIDATCLGAAQRLALADPHTLGAGEAFELAGVTMQLVLWQPDKRTGHLFVDIGVPSPAHRALVFEALLRLQMMLVGEIEGAFVLGEDGRLMMAVRMPAWHAIDAQTLAQFLTSLSEQSLRWRDTMLAGRFEDADDVGHAGPQLIANAGFLA